MIEKLILTNLIVMIYTCIHVYYVVASEPNGPKRPGLGLLLVMEWVVMFILCVAWVWS